MRLKQLVFYGTICNVILSSCGEKRKENNKPESFPVFTVYQKNIPLQKEYVADIDAIKNVAIYARVEGYLERVHIDEGCEVKKGDLLFSINSAEYAAELKKAKANLSESIALAKEAELGRDKTKMLVQQGVVSTAELEVAEARYSAALAKVEEARSLVQNAEIRLYHTKIYAPFDGMINRIPYKVGSLIHEGTELTTISDISEIFAYFSVSESEYIQYVKEGFNFKDDDVITELFLADGTEHLYEGKIETMEGQFNESTGSIAFRARFKNKDKLLKHGSTGIIRVSKSSKECVLVPQKATFEIQDKYFVYLVNDSNQVTIKSFVPAQRYHHYYVVQSGLKAGDRVIYEGIQTVRKGMRITPQKVSTDSIEVVSISQ
ncbi:MAG: efflux RND transporter periplasmic adaptor subunit [Cytophagaceae bacterium]|nr:efflux RND transporter periplasmic adaptor subunit [Cytophagaceae bacterium]MDW8455206.1 efflux RND transporter periplasmic adaptor subunit [Cytophagaceae bacterium]